MTIQQGSANSRGTPLKPDTIKAFEYMGIKINSVRFEQIHELIEKNMFNPGYICLTDVGNIINATRDPELKDAINGSMLSIADGMPLAWYGRLVGYKNVERISGMKLFTKLLAETEYKHFLIGDTWETINRVIEKAKQENEKIRISGFSPPFKAVFNESDNLNIINKINAEDPDIIWVSFGGGKQEKWMRENIGRLKKGILISVGAAFRFYIGDLITPPKIIQNFGFQWFFRLMQNPIRIFPLQIKTFPIFIINFPFEILRARKGSRDLQIDLELIRK